MKKKILDAFKAMGFEMEEMEKLGYSFQFEGKRYLYMYCKEDEHFLNIALPAILDPDDEDNVDFYQVMDKINRTRKYVKANMLNGSMWLFYERELFGGEDLELVLSCMIRHLDACFILLCRAMESKVDDSPSETYSNNGDDDHKEGVA